MIKQIVLCLTINLCSLSNRLYW